MEKLFRSNRFFRVFLVFIVFLIFLAGLAYAAINVWPLLGATTVDVLHGVFGDRAVSVVEDAILKTQDNQDNARQLTHQVTGSSPGSIGVQKPFSPSQEVKRTGLIPHLQRPQEAVVAKAAHNGMKTVIAVMSN